MIADALHDRPGARVAHREALAGQAAEEGASRRGAVQNGVADDHVSLCDELLAHPAPRADRKHTAREPLAGVVLRVAPQREGDARRQPGGKALPGRALEVHHDRVLLQPRRSARRRDAARQDPAHAAVAVADRQLEPHLRRGALRRGPCAVAQRRSVAPLCGVRGADHGLSCAHQLPVERVVEHSRWRFHAPARRSLGQLDVGEDVREVDAARLPVLDRRRGGEQVDAPDRLVQRTQADRGEDLAHFLGDEEEEVDHMLGRPLEALAQLGVLRGDADGARVQMAGAHHDAARRDQRRRREAHLVRAEHRRDDDVAARFELAVGLHDDARAQVVDEQSLLRLGQPDLPRHAGGLDR